MARLTKRHSIHGQDVYDTNENALVARGGFVAGGQKSIGNKGGNIVLPGNPARPAVFDDFLGDLVDDSWNFAENDTGAADISGVVAAGTNGIFRLAFVANSAPIPLNHGLINTGLFPQWKAKQGNLRFAARIKIDDLTGANVFAGFADTGASQMPMYDTGDDAGVPVALSSSAVGFLYAGGAGSPSTAWRGVAVNADTVATPVAGATPTDNVYEVLEIEFGDTGSGGDGDVAYFYQGGILKGSITNPVPTGRAMVPVISAFKSESNAVNVDIDWINVSAARDSGD
jgi:hypothetical protein